MRPARWRQQMCGGVLGHKKGHEPRGIGVLRQGRHRDQGLSVASVDVSCVGLGLVVGAVLGEGVEVLERIEILRAQRFTVGKSGRSNTAG